jgi:hypothetical protein
MNTNKLKEQIAKQLVVWEFMGCRETVERNWEEASDWERKEWLDKAEVIIKLFQDEQKFGKLYRIKE